MAEVQTGRMEHADATVPNVPMLASTMKERADVESARHAAPVETEASIPATTERPSTERRSPPRPVETPKVSLTLPEDSGLVLVETARSAAPLSASQETEAPRPRRVRPQRVQVVEEPLQIVETTRKDDTTPAT